MANITPLKRFSFLFALFIALSTLVIRPDVAQARLMCRSDPIVILSNGVTMDIGASISTMPWQVTEVHYELHIPQGVSVILAVQTPTWLTSQETFTVIADQAPNNYKVSTIVHTKVGNASVSADTTLISALKVKVGSYSASGMENQLLWVSFTDVR